MTESIIVETQNSFYQAKTRKDGKISVQRLQTKINCGALVSIFTEPIHIGFSWKLREGGEFTLLDEKGVVVFKTTEIKRIFTCRKPKKRQRDEMDLL